jgi:hypothetical protein
VNCWWIILFDHFLFSLFFCSAMNNFFSRFSIPYLALPFNVVAICSFTFIKNSNIVLKLTPGNFYITILSFCLSIAIFLGWRTHFLFQPILTISLLLKLIILSLSLHCKLARSFFLHFIRVLSLFSSAPRKKYFFS